MVQANNDRNVLKLPRQLELGLFDMSSIIGGGLTRRNAIHSFDFTTICSNKSLRIAWKKFSRGKQSRKDIVVFQKNLEANIQNLSDLLASGYYQHQRYKPFNICDPKRREIHKATVRDRLVHQAVVSAIEPMFERKFIYDSYSCRVNKGTYAGVAMLKLFLRQASRNNSHKVYVLKCDVRQFFASIDHEILMQRIDAMIDDEQTLELLRCILLSHSAEKGKGIPLGNVTSQLFANIYLHELDWFVKQTLGVKCYLRYCDDFVVVSTNKDYLESLIKPIRNFLADSLRLELHPNKVSIRSWNQGIDFLGYVLRPYSTSIRTKTKRRMIKRINENNTSSYRGVCSHANCYRLSQTLKLITWNKF